MHVRELAVNGILMPFHLGEQHLLLSKPLQSYIEDDRNGIVAVKL